MNVELPRPHPSEATTDSADSFLEDFFGDTPESPVLPPILRQTSLSKNSVSPDNQKSHVIISSLYSSASDMQYPIISSGLKTYDASAHSTAEPKGTPIPDLTLATRGAVLGAAEEAQLVQVYEQRMAQARAARCLDPNCFVDHRTGAPTPLPSYNVFRTAVIQEMCKLPSESLPPIDQPSSKSADSMLTLTNRQFRMNVLDSVVSAALPPVMTHAGGCACCAPSGAVIPVGSIFAPAEAQNTHTECTDPTCKDDHGKGKKKKKKKTRK